MFIKVEILRKILANSSEFELYSTFKRIDRDNKNYLSLANIKTFLDEKNIVYTDFNTREFIRHYDNDSDSLLNFEE